MSNEESNWFESFAEYFRYFCWCCIPPSKRAKHEEAVEETRQINNKNDEEIKDDGQIVSVCNRAYVIMVNGVDFCFGKRIYCLYSLCEAYFISSS